MWGWTGRGGEGGTAQGRRMGGVAPLSGALSGWPEKLLGGSLDLPGYGKRPRMQPNTTPNAEPADAASCASCEPRTGRGERGRVATGRERSYLRS